MHDNPLDHEDMSQAALGPELEHELECELKQLDQRIVRALETVPDPHISTDFAARVARQLPARRPVSLTPTHYGQNAMLIGTVVTLCALLALAVHATGHASFGLLESLLFAQFIALAVWLSVWRYGLR
jgi:hypothetical protein